METNTLPPTTSEQEVADAQAEAEAYQQDLEQWVEEWPSWVQGQ